MYLGFVEAREQRLPRDTSTFRGLKKVSFSKYLRVFNVKYVTKYRFGACPLAIDA